MWQRIVLGLGLVLVSGAVLAAKPAPMPQEHMIGVRVSIDAAGKVTSAQPSDPAAIAALNQAATEIARKLPFDPATKDGVAATSETSLFMLLALEPKANGQFGIRLKKAVSGPDRSKSAPLIPPSYQQRGDRSAMIVISVDLRPDGSVDPATIKPVLMELKVKSSFAEARYLDAIAASLRDSHYVLDKVAGTDVPARLTLPYKFGAGGQRQRAGEEDADEKDKAKDGKPVEKKPTPEMRAESLVPGVTLPKVRFTAPPEAPPAAS